MKDPKIKRAIVSVSNFEDVVEFCHILIEYGVEIFATVETLQILKKENIRVSPFYKLHGVVIFSEKIWDILHPSIVAGLALPMEKIAQNKHLENKNIKLVDLLVCNLGSPFKVINSKSFDLADDINIARLSMLSVGAANSRRVTVASESSDYHAILTDMSNHDGKVQGSTRFELACKSFKRISEYSRLTAHHLEA